MYNFDSIITRIKHLKKEQKLSNDDLAAISSIPKGTLSKILSGETKDPQISNIIKIAHALGVSADYLIYGKDMIFEYPSDKELDHIKKYRSLNENGKYKVDVYMDDLISNPNNLANPHILSEPIPLYNVGRAVAHGGKMIEIKLNPEQDKKADEILEKINAEKNKEYTSFTPEQDNQIEDLLKKIREVQKK